MPAKKKHNTLISAKFTESREKKNNTSILASTAKKKHNTWILAGGAKKKHNTSQGAGAKIPAKTLGIGSRVSAKKIFGGRFYRVLVARQREKNF